MINLLPSQEKQSLLDHHHHKLMMVLGFMLLVSLLAFALILTSLYFYILSQITYQKDLLKSAVTTYETADFLHYKGLISQYNRDLVKVNNFYKQEVSFSNALKIISTIPAPAGLKLLDISMERTKENLVKVSMSGNSDTREKLLAFKTSIELEKAITNIYFPPDNWIKSTDINFHVTFEIKRPQAP